MASSNFSKHGRANILAQIWSKNFLRTFQKHCWLKSVCDKEALTFCLWSIWIGIFGRIVKSYTIFMWYYNSWIFSGNSIKINKQFKRIMFRWLIWTILFSIKSNSISNGSLMTTKHFIQYYFLCLIKAHLDLCMGTETLSFNLTYQYTSKLHLGDDLST